MNDKPAAVTQASEDKKPSPFSEELPKLIDALECLYIKGNVTGRNIFFGNWPAAAELIFSKTLMEYDQDGVQNDEDKKTRAALEDEAEEKRMDMLTMLEALEQRCIKDGMLNIEFVKGMIEHSSRTFALYMFSAGLVDKFKPPPKT